MDLLFCFVVVKTCPLTSLCLLPRPPLSVFPPWQKWNGTGRDGLPVYDTAQRCGNQTFSIVYADNSRMSGSVCKDTIGLDGISYADQGIGKVFSWTQTLTLADG